MAWKLKNLTYKDMGKMKHRHLGHRNGQNIAVHVLTMLDDTSTYKVINGKMHVKDIHEHKNGRYKVRKKFIPIEEHNNGHYPKIKNPAVL